VDQKIFSVQDKIKNLIVHAGDILITNLGNAKKLPTASADAKIDTDFIIEEFLVDGISKLFPEHNIYSEEKGDINKNSDYTWVIDPIDGSYHYLRNLPVFAISVALKWQESFMLSSVFNPLLNEFFWSTIHEGASLNKTPIMVSNIEKLQDAILLADFPNGGVDEDILDKSFKIMKKLVQKTYRVRVMGVSSLAMCYVASGRADAYVSLSPRTRIYDKTAGTFIIEMAGGRVTDLSAQKKPLLACSNKKIHNALLEAMGQ